MLWMHKNTHYSFRGIIEPLLMFNFFTLSFGCFYVSVFYHEEQCIFIINTLVLGVHTQIWALVI